MPPKRKSERAVSASESTVTPSKRLRNDVAVTPASVAPASMVSASHHAGADRRGPGQCSTLSRLHIADMFRTA